MQHTFTLVSRQRGQSSVTDVESLTQLAHTLVDFGQFVRDNNL